jgi:hypothetical protein
MTSAGGGSEGGGVAVCCFIHLPCPAMKCVLGTATVDSVPQDYFFLVVLAMSESTSKY